jgi:hypothetical protein
MNYGYYAIETNVETTVGLDMEGHEDHTLSRISSDEDISREKKAVYTLVALPYRLEQLEQERK